MHCADAQLIKSIYQVIIYFIQAKLTNQRNPLQKKRSLLNATLWIYRYLNMIFVTSIFMTGNYPK